MTLPTPWDKGLVKVGSADHIHAVGAFALYYNDLEFTLLELFQTYVPLSHEARAHLFFTLHNRARIDLIQRLSADDPDVEQAEAVAFATKCFDICCENRNLIMHGIPIGPEDPALLRSEDWPHLSIAKPTKDRSLVKLYRFSLDQIREAARNTALVSSYILDLTGAIEDRRKCNPLALHLRQPLPDRPLQPRKLSPPPPKEAKKGGRPQPKS